LGGDITKKYGLYNEKTKIGRRVTFLVDKEGKIAEIQADSAAIDPTQIVTSCERRKLKS
jgi:alkyl hydroperoxide reductase subunit AhpC